MSKIYEYFVERNVTSGILIFGVVTLISYALTISFYSGYFLYADIQFLIGAVMGIYFTLRYRELDQSTLKYGLISGVGGGILASILIYIYETILLILTFGIGVILRLDILFFIALSGCLIGFLCGAIFSVLFEYRETKKEIKEETSEDDMFKELEDIR